MSATAAPGSPTTLKLNQFAFAPQVQMFCGTFYLLARLYEVIWMNRPFGNSFIILIGALCWFGVMYNWSIGAIPVHDLTLDGDELVITIRGKITRLPITSIRSIQENFSDNNYKVRFKDRRFINYVKGAGAKEFIQELSRRTGLVIEK